MILDPAVGRYLDAVRRPPDPLLAEMEGFAAEHRVPIAEPATARLVAMLARACGARAVLEIGLAIGYTALQVARALPPGGRVVALEIDARMADVARSYLARDPAGARVEIVPGDARETLPTLAAPFDLIYIDADKSGYPEYVEASLPLLRDGGLIVLDNLLMAGRVALGEGDDHWDQRSVDTALALNARLAADTDLDFVLLPLGDGVGVLQRHAR